MKIVFLSDDFPPQSFGGAGISAYELAVGMKNAGHEISVITTCRKNEDAGESDYKGLKIYRIASDYPSRWRSYVSIYNRPVIRQLRALLEQIRPDVVHANNIHFYLSYYSIKLAKRYAKAVVFTARDVMTFNFAKLDTKRYLEHFNARTTWRDHMRQAKKGWNPFRNFFIREYLKYADKIFAISGALKDALDQNGIHNVEVIHNGINIHQWDVDADTLSHARNKYGILNKKVLLFSGRLSSQKGGAKVIEALAQIVKEVPNSVLLVVGSIDSYARAMQAYAKSFGVEESIIFTGWIEREEVKVVYALSDVVLMPSICLDAFGRVNIEAMAAKKPVIGTCYGGTPEVVVDRVTGYIVNPLQLQEIAEKAVDLLKNPEKAERFGKAGYERVKRNFNLEGKVREYIAAYKSVIEK